VIVIVAVHHLTLNYTQLQSYAVQVWMEGVVTNAQCQPSFTIVLV